MTLNDAEMDLHGLLLNRKLVLLALTFVPTVVIKTGLNFTRVISSCPMRFALLHFLTNVSIACVLLTVAMFVTI